MKRAVYSERTKFRALDLLAKGTKVREVGKTLNVSPKLVSAWKNSQRLMAEHARPRRYSKYEPPVPVTPIARCAECGSDEGFRHYPICSVQDGGPNVVRLMGEVVTREQCRVR